MCLHGALTAYLRMIWASFPESPPPSLFPCIFWPVSNPLKDRGFKANSFHPVFRIPYIRQKERSCFADIKDRFSYFTCLTYCSKPKPLKSQQAAHFRMFHSDSLSSPSFCPSCARDFCKVRPKTHTFPHGKPLCLLFPLPASIICPYGCTHVVKDPENPAGHPGRQEYSAIHSVFSSISPADDMYPYFAVSTEVPGLRNVILACCPHGSGCACSGAEKPEQCRHLLLFPYSRPIRSASSLQDAASYMTCPGSLHGRPGNP